MVSDDEEFDSMMDGSGILAGDGPTPKKPAIITSISPTMDGILAPLPALKNPSALLGDPSMLSPTTFGKVLESMMNVDMVADPSASLGPTIAPMPAGHNAQNPPPRKTINPSELAGNNGVSSIKRPRAKKGSGVEM